MNVAIFYISICPLLFLTSIRYSHISLDVDAYGVFDIIIAGIITYLIIMLIIFIWGFLYYRKV